jgi:hypothetical protein
MRMSITASASILMGVINNLALVRVNGQDLGIVWLAPRHVDITAAVRAGKFRL